MEFATLASELLGPKHTLKRLFSGEAGMGLYEIRFTDAHGVGSGDPILGPRKLPLGERGRDSSQGKFPHSCFF